MNPTVQAIAWTLIHFCWQAAAIAAAYRGASLVFARATSNSRYLLALSALLLMLATSVVTFAWEMRPAFTASASIEYPSAGASATANISPVKSSGSPTSVPSALNATAPENTLTVGWAMPRLPLAALRVIDGIWLLGVLALSLRSLGGWWFTQRLRSMADIEAPAAIRASFRRIAHQLGLRRPVLLRLSNAISGPLTIGALRAVVLLPVSAATSLSPDELEVVLAHELAHVCRADYLWNLLQTFVETLFFFHPAVWWLGSRIRHERELCCDDMALDLCPNPMAYANALFNLELQRNTSGRFAMALNGHQPAQTLRMRIARILGEPTTGAVPRGQFSLAAVAAAFVILLLPVPQVLASFYPDEPQAHVQTTVQVHPVVTVAPVVADVLANVDHFAVKADTSVNVKASMQASSQTPSAQAAPPAGETEATPQAEAEKDEPVKGSGKGDYIDRMKAAGYDVDLDKYIGMKVQGITPEYARAMSQLGFGKLSADDLIACKVQDVTPETIAQLKRDGLEVKTVQQAIQYRIFSVTPEFVAGMKAAGFANLTSEQMVALRTQDVTPEYARTIAQQFPGATPDDLVKSRIFNINSDFIASAKKHGFTDLSFEKLVKLRISGILDDDESDK